MPWTTLCSLADLTEGQGKYVEIDGHQLAVFLHQGQPHVLDNYCPHAGGSLASGYVEDDCAVCPWHHWPFRLDSGYLKHSTAVQVTTYNTRLHPQPNAPPLVQADLPMP